VLPHLEHLPKTGERIETSGWHLEVVDLDGRRIDNVLAPDRPGGHSGWRQRTAGRLLRCKGWSDALIEALAQPERFDDLRATARKTIVERYDIRRQCLPKLLAFVESG
jgi:hypothetical protein